MGRSLREVDLGAGAVRAVLVGAAIAVLAGCGMDANVAGRRPERPDNASRFLKGRPVSQQPARPYGPERGSLGAVRIHIWPTQHWVDDEAWSTIVAIANGAEGEIRERLPTLERDLYLIINPSELVIPETGDGGFTLGPHCIRWDVDPQRGVAAVARGHLRRTLYHECHHAVRLQRRPQEAETLDWPTVAVFEGLASVFELAAGGERHPYQQYDEQLIADWAVELFSQPVDESWAQWKFEHPDGRRNIAYRVGTWIADRAVQASGRSAADLVWESPADVIGLAGL